MPSLGTFANITTSQGLLSVYAFCYSFVLGPPALIVALVLLLCNWLQIKFQVF